MRSFTKKGAGNDRRADGGEGHKKALPTGHRKSFILYNALIISFSSDLSVTPVA